LKIAESPGVVFLVALTMRVWVLSQLLPEKAWQYFYRYNEPSHIAWALASGFGYSSPWPNTPVAATAQQPPIYPLLLAGIFKLAGVYSYRSLWIATGLNAVISAITAVLILKLGKRMFDRPTGILAAWVWACWLFESASTVRLWESSLAALFLAIGLMLLPELAVSLRCWRWLFLGVLTGIAALTNTTLLSIFPFFWVWLWIKYRRQGRSCSKMLLASIALCILTVLPWTIRNYITFHRLMPMRDNFGLELWVGIELGDGKPKAVITRLFPRDFPLSDPTEYNRLGEIAFMDSRGRLARDFIREHPGEYAHFVGSRMVRYWTEPAGTSWATVSLLAWLGILLALKRKGLDAMPYAIVLVMFPLVYYITHTYPTYRHPMEPQILLLAAYAAVSSVGSLAIALNGLPAGARFPDNTAAGTVGRP
jgi:4-amino-4-deoxy-L-arabinose transferase-like glycosyltransferase